MSEHPHLTTRKRSIGADGELTWGDREHPWDVETESANGISFDSGALHPESVRVVDDYERETLKFYSGDTGNYEVQSDIAYRGGRALRCTTSSTSGSNLLYSLSGLPYYPEEGDTISLWTRTDEEHGSLARPTFAFGVQSDVSNRYWCRLRYPYSGDPAEFNSNFIGNYTLTYSYSLSEWYKLLIKWGLNGEFTVEILDEDNNLLDGPFTGTDTRWSTGGIGFNSSGGADEVYDYVTA